MDVREESVPGLSSFWWLVSFFGVPWLLLHHLDFLPSPSRGILPVRASVSKFLLFIRTLVVLD